MNIDPRLMERRKTVAEDKAKRNIGRLLKFLSLLVVVGAGVWVVFSPWLSVKQVVAHGIESSAANSVLAESRVRAGTPMILIDGSRVESLLLADPWVAEAKVHRDWPGTVIVDVVERRPVAWVRTAVGWTRRAIDGVALPSESEPDDVMARVDMPEISDEQAVSSIELRGALEFVAALPGDLRAGTVVTMSDDELWASVGGYEVRLGRSDEMTEKALSLATLLEENIPEDSTLTLIAPTNPAVLGPSPDDPEDEDPENEEGNEDGDSDDTPGDADDQTSDDS
jgi:cell division protein FtsQ